MCANLKSNPNNSKHKFRATCPRKDRSADSYLSSGVRPSSAAATSDLLSARDHRTSGKHFRCFYGRGRPHSANRYWTEVRAPTPLLDASCILANFRKKGLQFFAVLLKTACVGVWFSLTFKFLNQFRLGASIPHDQDCGVAQRSCRNERANFFSRRQRKQT